MKRVGIVLGVLIGLLVLAVAALTLFFPTERATAYAVERIEAATGRPVSIGGSKVSILPRASLTLTDVTFGGEARPGEPRLAAADIQLALRLLPLLKRQVDVKELRLVRPEVDVVLDDTAAPPPEPKASGTGSASVDVSIDRFVVEDGAVRVHLADGSPLLVLTGLDQTLSLSASAGGDVTVDGSTRARELQLTLATGTLGQGLAPSLDTSLRYDAAEDRLTVARASLDVAGVPVDVTGHVDALRTRDLVAELSVAGGPGEVGQLVSLLPAGLFPAMDGMTSSGQLRVSGRVTGPLTKPGGPDFNVSLTVEEGRVQYPGFANAIDGIALRLNATPDTVVVQEFAARSGGNTLRAHAAVADYRTAPTLRLAYDADLDLDRLGEFYPTPEGVTLGGQIQGQGLCEGPLDRPADLAVSGTATAKALRVQNASMRVPLHDINGDIVFDRNRATTTQLSGKLGTSELFVSGEVLNPLALVPALQTTERAIADVSLRSPRLNLDELMAPPGEGPATGAANEVIAIPELPRLDGTLRLAADQLRLNRVEATSATGLLTLNEGVFGIREAVFDAFGGAVRLDGSMDLNERVRPSFDMKTVVEGAAIDQLLAYNESLAKFNLLGQSLKGNMSVTADMDGSLTDALRLDLATLTSAGNLQVAQATLAGHPLQDKLSTFLKSESVKNMSVSQLAQHFTIRDGRLILDELNLQAGPFEVAGEGSTSFDGAYALNLDLWLPESAAEGVRDKLSPEVAAVLFGTGQRVMLPLVIKGQRSQQPDVALDQAKLSAEAQARAKARLEAEKQKLLEDAKSQAADAVKGLLGAPPDSTPPVDPAKQQVETKVKDALKGLFGGKK